MDEINDFFNLSKDFKRVVVPSGLPTRTTLDTGITESKLPERKKIGTKYAKVYADAEKQQMLHSFKYGESSKAHQSYMDEMEELDDDDEEMKEQCIKTETDIYEKYNFNIRSYTDLPIHEYQMEIMKRIRENRAVILEGDTGCGKTTQVPQYILDDACKRQEYCNIVCTQPRRIAAISIARRVCSERKWQCGSVVGYQVGLHAQSSEDTRLLYCTTGVLLEKLVRTKSMSNFTHIVLDEVHERDQDMDFLLIIIRRLLTTNSKNVKVILMSATIDSDLFAEYFRLGPHPAPIIKIDAMRLFHVKDFYLCELEKLQTHATIEPNDPDISDAMYNTAVRLVAVCDKIDDGDVTVETLGYKPTVLIFLPGINEIRKMEKMMDILPSIKSGIRVWPIRLHSMISPEDQEQVFKKPPNGVRKVILSTNIAESSITVPDVKYVIDFCLTRSLICDTTKNLTSLQLHWASRSNCKQRAGRAGRVMNGRVYRLVPKDFYLNDMDEYGIPEMVRCPLEKVVLKSKLLDMGSPHTILGLALTPPNLSDICNTILTLKEVGALYKTVNGHYEEYDGDLSFVGRVMAALPLDIHMTRLIIFGYVFSVLDETIIMAAGLSVKSIFSGSIKNALHAFSVKMTFADGSGSDLFAMLKAYKTWCGMREQHLMVDEEQERTWANRYFVNTRSMREMHLLVEEIRSRLSKFDIKEFGRSMRINWLEREKTMVLKICIAGAFYPNYFVRHSHGANESEKDIYSTICGNDPCRTVYFTNFNSRHIGQLYTKSIKQMLAETLIPERNIEVKFAPGTEKVFIIFKNDDIESNSTSGRVWPDVYKALKFKQLGMTATLKVMSPQNEVAYAEERGLGVMQEGRWIPNRKIIKHPELVVIPPVFTGSVRGIVTHIDHCNSFWFQPFEESDRLREITTFLNGEYSDVHEFNNPSAVSRGMIVAASYNGQHYERAKVLQVDTTAQSSSKTLKFRVLFIDYGNTDTVEFDKLRRLGEACKYLIELPPRVFQCRLAGISPSTLKSPSGTWPEEAIEYMQAIVKRGPIELQIYSVVYNVAAVIMYVGQSNFNVELVNKGWAQKCDENYMSKDDHDLRLRKQSIPDTTIDDHAAENEEYLRSLQTEIDMEIDPPPAELCYQRVRLRGPFSPLETRIYAATRLAEYKTVKVEQDSINSVSIDSEPQNSRDRLIVAASVSETHASIIARQTTLLPNVPGLGALVTLLFCSNMQIRRDSSRSKYVAILAGLGHDKNYNSLYPEHDIFLNLDVEIDPSDLEVINQIRYSMDTILYTDPGDDMPKTMRNNRSELNAKIKAAITTLLEKNRRFIGSHHDTTDKQWIRLDDDEVIESSNMYGHRSLFPIHPGLRLYQESFERIDMLQRHCDDLHRLKQFDSLGRIRSCQLCDMPLEKIADLRIHLLSQVHLDREAQIMYQRRS